MMMKDRIQITDDGSHTLYNENVGENYHSSFGAIQESKHIFIDAGLNTTIDKNIVDIKILEVGVGTGLNVLLAYLWSTNNNNTTEYHGYEPYTISKREVSLLNYSNQLQIDDETFLLIHKESNKLVNLSNYFSFITNEIPIENAKLPTEFYDVVFFDAFSPTAQPELWTPEIFSIIFTSMKKGGVLTTYSCKGSVKRALKEVGFKIEKLPGPPGKREFLRAWKP